MVNTRSSQFSRKRRRNSSASPSQAGSQASKVRKSNGRHFPTADSQLREEQRMSLERSQESPEGSSTSALHSLECHTPTHSRQNRHSLPANLQVPADVKFEPLIVAIARENQRRRRYTEGLAAGDEDSAADVAGTNTYIELADLGINASQLMTPRSRSIAQPKHTPLSITRRPSPNVKREEDVANYQDVIQKITKENAELLAQVHILRPAIRSLGFGEVDMLEEDICAAIRVNFDELRAQLQEIGAIDLPLEQLCNQELLQCQPDIVRGLLQGIDQYSQAYQEVENRLALIDAEYKGVLRKLAEREERNEVQVALLMKADELATAQAEELKTLCATGNDLRQTIENLKQDIRRNEEEFNQEADALEEDKKESLALMVEELNQEHIYRQIAEQEIDAKDSAYTSLQIKYQDTKSELDNAKVELAESEQLIKSQEDEITNLKDELKVEQNEKREIEETFFDLEEKAAELEEDIKTLTERLEQGAETIEEQEDALDAAKLQLKAKETEINQLRSDVFGVQEEIKHKTNVATKLEGAIEALNKSMEDLQEEKDAVIEEKNTKLDEREATIDDLTKDNEQKDSDIEALRQENLRVLAANEELRKAFATRGKDMRVLKDITSQLLTDADQDIATQRDWASRKAAMVEDVRQAIDAVGTEGGASTTLTQEVEKTVIRKTTSVRDSGYLEEEDDLSMGELLLESGY